MQEAAHSESWKQLPADSSVTFRGADRPHAAGAPGEPPRVPARGAGGVSAAEAERPGRGRRSL